MTGTIVTNNPKVLSELGATHAVAYEVGSFADVLVRVRDLVHKGHKLLTHPLSGSIKPGETPYKSILVSDEAGTLDLESLQLVENAILTAAKFGPKYGQLSASVDRDFQLLDCTLIKGAL